jgi:hypothetical protein
MNLLQTMAAIVEHFSGILYGLETVDHSAFVLPLT